MDMDTTVPKLREGQRQSANADASTNANAHVNANTNTNADVNANTNVNPNGFLLRYPPELFQALTHFFQKTLSSSVSGRYWSMGEVMELLDTLIRLSDSEVRFLYPNFSYHSSCFVGRRAEIQEIAENLQRSDVLFLSGIGGIGKTETARRFAYEHQEEFRVESDPRLEDLLECPCKFLITSREDFRDYNYVQTDISRMKGMFLKMWRGI